MNIINWDITKAVKINLVEEDDFLKIKESLTRIGVINFKNKELFQSCHILHKKGDYYIVHFKLMFALDGRKVEFIEDDWKRQNRIAKILSEWGLCDLVTQINDDDMVHQSNIKVLKYKDKQEWTLRQKYKL
jgi:hypothetical protein